MVEDLLKEYPNVLILRVRMPIVADLTYPRNFITKIIKYDKVLKSELLLLCALWYIRIVSTAFDAGVTCWCILQVVDIPNSMTVLPELLPYSIEMVSSIHQQLLYSPLGLPRVTSAIWILLSVCCMCVLQAQRGLTGIMNYTNPGTVSHNEILEMYKEYIDPEFKWSNFTIEEQSKVIVAARSNNLLDTKRVSYAFHLLPVSCAIVGHVYHLPGRV